MSIRMLPPLPLDRFRQVANAAGKGAVLALVSRHKLSEAQTLAREVGYIVLANAPSFTDIFVQAMYQGEQRPRED